MCICQAQFHSRSLGVRGFDVLDFSLVTDSLKDGGLPSLVYSTDLNHLLKISGQDSRPPGMAPWCHDLWGLSSSEKSSVVQDKKIKIAAVRSDRAKGT